MKGQRGFSLVELLVAGGISTVLFGLTSAVFLSSVSNLRRANQQSDVDNLYLNTLQGLRNVPQLQTLIPVTAASDLAQCLGGNRATCQINPDVDTESCANGAANSCASFVGPSKFNDPRLNALYASNERCGADTAAITASCNLRVQTSYQWVCANSGCTGFSALQVNISVKPFEGDGTPSKSLAERTGSFTIPGHAFASKNAITMKCAPGVLPLRGFNYANATDECQYIPTDYPCPGPAMIYGEVVVCQPTQDKGNCGGAGFQNVGLASAQVQCPAGYTAPATGPLALGGSDGSYNPPSPPFFGYVPPPPPPPPPSGDGGGGGGGGGGGDGGVPWAGPGDGGPGPGDGGGPGPGDGGAPGDGGFPVAGNGGGGPPAGDGGPPPVFNTDGDGCGWGQMGPLCMGDGDGGGDGGGG